MDQITVLPAADLCHGKGVIPCIRCKCPLGPSSNKAVFCVHCHRERMDLIHRAWRASVLLSTAATATVSAQARARSAFPWPLTPFPSF